MPLEAGKDKVGKNIEELLHTYKKTGKIGNTTPRDMKHAKEIASGIAYSKAKSKKKKFKKFLESLKNEQNLILIEAMELGFDTLLEHTGYQMDIEHARSVASEFAEDGDALKIFEETGTIIDNEHKIAILEEIASLINALLKAASDNTPVENQEQKEEELLDLQDFVKNFPINSGMSKT